MKKFVWLLLLIFSVQITLAQKELTIMTFNIRLDLASDSLNAWPYRKDKVPAQVLFHKVDILGVQEAKPGQMKDLQSSLTGYEHVGVGRDDGADKGEYSAIFYNKKRITVLQSSTFWLSQFPQQAGSKGWDADYPRIVTWAKLKDKQTDKLFFVFNTHFDHMGKVARRESARMLLKAVDSLAGKNEAVIMGDFNATVMDEPIQIITDSSNRLHLTDTKSISVTPHYGPSGTFNAFGPSEVNDFAIDHIFINHGIRVLEHATISQSWNGRFASDHFAVLTKILL